MVKFITVITFIIMILMNALANIIPINGITTGQVSDYYENLFTPAGYTFSIWGVIYLLLFMYTFYQVYFSWNKYAVRKVTLFKETSILFSISSVANSLWIVSWHYKKIPLSVVLILTILICMIFISLKLKKFKLSYREKIFIRVPFSIYFGWITVASIANMMVFLVYLNWHWFGLNEYIWTVMALATGCFIGTFVIIKNRDVIYGLPIIWAYIGIFFRHFFEKDLSNNYQILMLSIILSILILIFAEFIVIKKKNS